MITRTAIKRGSRVLVKRHGLGTTEEGIVIDAQRDHVLVRFKSWWIFHRDEWIQINGPETTVVLPNYDELLNKTIDGT